MVEPETLTDTAASGELAGPETTEPSLALNCEPWHGHWMTLFEMVDAVQPWWVQTAVKALYSPALGWVTTTLADWSMKPPSTGTFEVATDVPLPPAAAVELLEPPAAAVVPPAAAAVCAADP